MDLTVTKIKNTYFDNRVNPPFPKHFIRHIHCEDYVHKSCDEICTLTEIINNSIIYEIDSLYKLYVTDHRDPPSESFQPSKRQLTFEELETQNKYKYTRTSVIVVNTETQKYESSIMFNNQNLKITFIPISEYGLPQEISDTIYDFNKNNNNNNNNNKNNENKMFKILINKNSVNILTNTLNLRNMVLNKSEEKILAYIQLVKYSNNNDINFGFEVYKKIKKYKWFSGKEYKFVKLSPKGQINDAVLHINKGFYYGEIDDGYNKGHFNLDFRNLLSTMKIADDIADTDAPDTGWFGGKSRRCRRCRKCRSRKTSSRRK